MSRPAWEQRDAKAKRAEWLTSYKRWLFCGGDYPDDSLLERAMERGGVIRAWDNLSPRTGSPERRLPRSPDSVPSSLESWCRNWRAR